MNRTCFRCKAEKPLEAFYRAKANPLGRGYQCSECARAYDLAKRKANPEKYRKKSKDFYYKNLENCRMKNKQYRINNRDKQALYKIVCMYGISAAEYEAIYRSQNGKCAICEKINLDGKRLSVDHDHKTGKVRGLLCRRCNLMLGQAADSVEVFNKAIDYILRPAAVRGGFL